MKIEVWTEVERLYHAALELSPEEREAFLESACSGNNEVLREVNALLSYDRQATDFIETPAIDFIAREIAKDTPSQRPTENNEPGQIGDYQIITRLGKGGMSEVYLAHDPKLGRKVALKVLSPEFTEAPDRIKRLRVEARAMSSLNHPNIVTIYEVGCDAGTHYIAEEYVEGRTLRLRINESDTKKIPPVETIEIGAQIADALAVAHETGVTHRDVKPENIVIRPDGIVKVLDFGLAKVADAIHTGLDDETVTEAKVTTDPGLVIGTPRYMSPEQARGLKVDSRTDVFSLGVMLYEMVAGRPPFDGVNSLDLIGAILNRDPLPLSQHAPDVPVELERIIFKCLEKDREARYQSARDLADDLRRIKGLVTTEGYIPAGKRIGSAGSKKLWLLAGAAVILAALAAFPLFYYRRAPAAGSSEIRTLAVLPLATIGNQPGPDYRGLGIADTIITKISRLDELVVRPTSAIRRYLNHQTEALQAAHEQQVDAVLDGTIQQNGDRLRISFNLIRTSDGTSLWADQFDLDFIEIFGLQDKVARQIVERLRYRISAAEKDKVAKNHTNNPEAYDNYLKATYYYSDTRNFWWEREQTDKAVALFRKAIELDPGYAQAHAMLGACYIQIATWHEENPDLFRQASRELDIAEKLDPQLAVVHLLRSSIYDSHHSGYRYEELSRAIKRAQQLDPNIGHGRLGAVYQHLGFQECYQEFERALELEPASDSIKNSIVSAYLTDINPEGALAAVKRFSFDSKWPYHTGTLAWAYMDRKMPDEASPHISVMYKAGRDALNLNGLKMALEGKYQQAEATITEDWVRRKIPPVYHPTYHHFAHNAARIYALQGKSEEAIKWLRISAEEGFPNYPAFSRDPYLDGIRKHPDFIRFMADLKTRWEGYRRLFLNN